MTMQRVDHETGWRNRIVRTGMASLDQIAFNPKNWRIHPKSQQDALAGVLSEVGVVQHVIINERTGNLVDGHLRVTLADRNGEPAVPAVWVDLEAAEEALILATLDPLSAMAATDRDQLSALLEEVSTSDAALRGMLDQLAQDSGIDLGAPRAEDPGPQIDRADELRQKWGTARGQLWEVGRHRLLCGDATSAEDVARLADDGEFEMIWTDPPYGVAVGDKNKYLNSIARSNRVEENLTNDTLDEPALVAMLEQSFDCAMAHCLAGAAWYVAAPPGPLHVLFGQVLKDRGIWRQTIQWVKNNATFAPLGVDYHWRSEPIFYGWLPNGGHRYHGGRQQDTVWNIDRPQRSPEHPTMKPVELVARALENSSRPNEIVYDPFLGSGTTMVAAEQTGRICYGMEIEPKYICSGTTVVAAEQTGRICYGMEIEPKYIAVTLERLSGMGLTPRLLQEAAV